MDWDAFGKFVTTVGVPGSAVLYLIYWMTKKFNGKIDANTAEVRANSAKIEANTNAIRENTAVLKRRKPRKGGE